MSKILNQRSKSCQQNLSQTNRKPAENIKEINRLKHQTNKVLDINGAPNIIDESIVEDISIRRSNSNDKRFIDDFVDFKIFVSLEFQNINQKIANVNMKN